MTGTTEISYLQIPAGQGANLAATCVHPAAGRSGGNWIVISSAMAAPRRFYQPLAEYLAGRGYKVIIFDHRGIGDSADCHPRANKSTLSDWGQLDLEAVLQWILKRGQAERTYLIGHSLGGQLPGIAPSARLIAGLILVNTPSGYWRNWSGLYQAGIFLTFHIAIPLISRIFGYLPGWALGGGEPVQAGVAREWASWGRHPDYICRPDTGPRPRIFDQIEAPILCWDIEDDPLAPAKAVDALLAFYSSARITRRTVSKKESEHTPLGHWGWFRESKGRPLWRETADWLDRQSQP